MANVTLKGGVVKEYENGTTAMEIAKSIGMGLYKAVCICKINGEYQDLRTPITGDCELEFLTFEDDEEAKRTFRHTASHILAQAVKRLYPEAKLAIGPSIANGFYYDFDVEKPFLVGVPALEQLKAFGDADMQISVADNWVLFQNEHVRLLAKRIQNVTPMTYESVVPQKWNEEFCFHRKDFVQALKYLLACIGKTDKPYVRFENGLLTLRAKDCLYKAAVSISAESSIIFGFDARFMLDALTQFEKQELVTMRLTSPLGAILLVAGNSSAIVLPVRLREELNAA